MMMIDSIPAPVVTPLGPVREKLTIRLTSFGVKNNIPWPPADLYLDCRGVANPMHAIGLNGTGDDPGVQKWVEIHCDMMGFHHTVYSALIRLTTRRGAGKEFEKPFNIVCMCAHGIHRSRSMKHILGRWLVEQKFQLVEVK